MLLLVRKHRLICLQFNSLTYLLTVCPPVCLLACREMAESRSGELAARLGSGDAEQAAEACDEAAEMYQRELGLAEEVVAAVRRLGSPGRKAARLAGAMRRCGLRGAAAWLAYNCGELQSSV